MASGTLDANGSSRAPGAERRGPVRLASEPSFRIGDLLVEPPLRRMSLPDGREEIVEPRVMQVLVALHQANGAIISRDELVERCWEGRIVGEDAINRVISRIRRLSETIGRSRFQVGTVAKVGYRLMRLGGATGTAGADDSPPASAARRLIASWPAALAGALAVVMIAAGVLFLGGRSEARVEVAVTADAGSSAQTIAKDLAVDLGRLASRRTRSPYAIVEKTGAADFIVKVGASEVAGRLRVNVELMGAGAEQLLWSHALDIAAAEEGVVRPRIEAEVANLLACSLDPVAGREAEVELLRPLLAACARGDRGADEELIMLLTRAVEAAPSSAVLLARLAHAEAQLASGEGSNPRLIRSASEHLAAARGRDPTVPAIYLAEDALLARWEWAKRSEIVRKGLAANPDAAALHALEADLLARTGRMAAAAASLEEAFALEPTDQQIRYRLILALAGSGQPELARRHLAVAKTIWPGAQRLLWAQWVLNLRHGDPGAALAMLESGEASRAFGAPEIVVRALLEGRPDQRARAVRRAAWEAAGVPGNIRERLQTLGQLGAIDEAYAVMEQPQVLFHLRHGSDVLFVPHLAAFRKDRRFLPLAARLGLVRYWQESGNWPDFCADPILPYDCPAEARRLLASRR